MNTVFKISFFLSCCINLFFFLKKPEDQCPIITKETIHESKKEHSPIQIPSGHRYIELNIPKQSNLNYLKKKQIVDIVVKSNDNSSMMIMPHKEIIKLEEKETQNILGIFLNLKELSTYIKLPTHLHYSILPKNPLDDSYHYPTTKWKILTEG